MITPTHTHTRTHTLVLGLSGTTAHRSSAPTPQTRRLGPKRSLLSHVCCPNTCWVILGIWYGCCCWEHGNSCLKEHSSVLFLCCFCSTYTHDFHTTSSNCLTVAYNGSLRTAVEFCKILMWCRILVTKTPDVYNLFTWTSGKFRRLFGKSCSLGINILFFFFFFF